MRVRRYDAKASGVRFIIIKRDGAYRAICLKRGSDRVMELDKEFKSISMARYYLGDWYGVTTRGRERDVPGRGWEKWKEVVDSLLAGTFPERDFVKRFPVQSR